ncbi:MAG: hypothetical protein Q7J00_01380, partial [Synergistaceae bacterium]|nr:hypothetical protein [Synergistaceae bacterium]
YKGLAGKVSDETWEFVLIVSSCEIVDEVKGSEVIYEDETTGLVIGVDKSKDEKCPRCWKRRPEVAEKGLCSRCKDVIGD